MKHQNKHQFAAFAALITLVLTVLMGSSAAFARNDPTSDLLLPYFEVDMTGAGVSTYFAVVNSSPSSVKVEMKVFSNWGIEIFATETTLEGEEARSINLAQWLIQGKLFDRTLSADELSHCQAALMGERSRPATVLSRSSE